MKPRINTFLTVALLSLLPTLLLWIPYFLRLKTFWSIPLPSDGMGTIVSNYDGPLYIVIAKTLYNNTAIAQNFSFSLPIEYYAAHFPFYPALIKLVSPIFGYLYGMLFVTLASSVFALYYFYLLVRDHIDKKNAILITAIFSVFPARWLIVRSVGSPEPLFIGAIIASVYYFLNKKYWLAGLFGAIAQLTKSPGILLFIAYIAAIVIPNFHKIVTNKLGKWIKILDLKKVYPLLLIPFALVLLFILYSYQFGDFWAYFNSGDNIHLFFPPFQIFNYSAAWVGTFWLEEIIYIYLLSFIGVYKLFERKKDIIFWFSLIMFITIIFVSHRDVSRYALPIAPFLLISYSDILITKKVKYAILFLIIPIFLFSLAYISQNTMPISDWTPLL